MQDDVLLSNSCSEITHVISNDRDVLDVSLFCPLSTDYETILKIY